MPQAIPGFVHPLWLEIGVLKTKSAVLRWANTDRIVTEIMKKTIWQMPPTSSNALRSCLNHRLSMKGSRISPHIIRAVCHDFGT